jgi:hypothetical protein
MKRALLVVIAIAGMTASQAGATISDLPDEGGYKRFLDQNTGRVWLDLNNFFNQSYNQMAAAATAAGYTLATQGDVQGLVNNLPLGANQWPGYASIMGSARNRGVIWGGYDTGDSQTYGWAWSYDTDTTWSFASPISGKDDVPGGGGDFADMSIWAFKAVPEPSTWLAGAGMLAGLLGTMIRRKA